MDSRKTQLIQALELEPLPFMQYREVYKSQFPQQVYWPRGEPRSACSHIYSLYCSEKPINWLHQLKGDELWHFHMGHPITIVEFSESGGAPKKTVLGNDFEEIVKGNQVPFYTVKANTWFGSYLDSYAGAKESTGSSDDFALCGCTVTPGFEFADSTMYKHDDSFQIPPEYNFLIGI